MANALSPRIEKFVQELDKVRVHRSPQGAPSRKKPLLILLVLHKLRKGEIKENSIPFADIEAELGAWIRAYGEVGNNSPGPAEPFYHLRTSPFWRIDDFVMGPDGHCKKFSAGALKACKVAGHLEESLFKVLTGNRDGCRAAAEAVLKKWWPEGAPNALQQMFLG